MQKLGRKSIVVEIVISNRTNPENPFIVKVQANKNYGICNVIQGTKYLKEVVDQKTQQKKTIMKFSFVRRLDSILSTFQGRQINDAAVFEHLNNVLNETLNSHE